MPRWLSRLTARAPRHPSELISDPTLQLLRSDWKCACCGEWHHGIMDLGAQAPDPWPHARDHEPNGALRLDGDFLSEDFCVIDGEHFFVRGIMEIPVQGLEEEWGFGCWTTLSRTNFETYVAAFDDHRPATEGSWFGWLSNRLLTLHQSDDFLKLDVYPQSGRQRPRLFVQDAELPLGIAQREGLSPSTLLAILRAYGHGPTLQ